MATILVVDDDPAVLRMIAILLEGAGHTIMKASNGLEALLVYQSYAQHIDLLLTDIDMPQMNGVELAARIRATHPFASILLMTGAVPLGAPLPASLLVLEKPFQRDTLLGAVRSAFQQPPSQKMK